MANTGIGTARRHAPRQTVAQRVRRWYAQLQVNGALEDAGILDWDSFHAAQEATWRAIDDRLAPWEPLNAVHTAVMEMLRRDMFAPRSTGSTTALVGGGAR
jgi:hypothetical protein